MKILLVDDDPMVGEMLAMILQSCDYEVETAEGGAEALAKLAAGGVVDLVISDMNMPGMDGRQFLARLRQTGNKVPFAMLTGDETSGRMVDPEVDLYLLKDENIQETIVEAVETLLNGG